MQHRAILAFFLGLLFSSVPLAAQSYLMLRELSDVKNELTSKDKQITLLKGEIEELQKTSYTTESKGLVEVTGQLRIVGNEPFTELAIEADVETYILSFNQSRLNYPKDLASHQGETVWTKGYLSEWKDFMNRTYKVIDVTEFRSQ